MLSGMSNLQVTDRMNPGSLCRSGKYLHLLAQFLLGRLDNRLRFHVIAYVRGSRNGQNVKPSSEMIGEVQR